jgi:hypothetical protein
VTEQTQDYIVHQAGFITRIGYFSNLYPEYTYLLQIHAELQVSTAAFVLFSSRGDSLQISITSL